jgi:hypothetical protein
MATKIFSDFVRETVYRAAAQDAVLFNFAAAFCYEIVMFWRIKPRENLPE